MITHPLLYLFSLACLVTIFYLLESKTSLRIFKLIPAVVFIYASSMLLASLGLFDSNAEISSIYKQTKTNLLPAMLFLMLLQVDLRHFLKLGKSLLIAYILAVLSIAFGFIVVAIIFDFSSSMSGAFGALAGSWLGGTANMIAVGSALNVDEEAFAYALVVDSVNYTLWVMLLLFLVPFAQYFNKFTQSSENLAYLGDIACACTIGAKRYWILILLALAVSLLTQYLETLFSVINATTTIVILASVFGILASFTRLRDLNGSSELSTSMLYLLIALIGSHAVIESFSGLGLYVLAGFCILIVHTIVMIVGAKLFKLDLFSIAVASLANIGGVASTPILAAAYNKSLVSVGILMAIMGYIIGTFGGLLLGNILIGLS
ncbi:MAG: hypothetical protein SPLUMA2_SPLUMAMAG2_00291 [uncultured Sulfurimonas sp.]|nr:MAG: hypothetical protein SPLUMA1_SPLUMAMAG1_00224 [uncultured Sulfurimonas sp.]CAI6152746.1 MAG: hypothetical protein SPLUMA2_SPLUMAMAG2_00291 [uncultured Sulfurimonas sp.]